MAHSCLWQLGLLLSSMPLPVNIHAEFTLHTALSMQSWAAGESSGTTEGGELGWAWYWVTCSSADSLALSLGVWHSEALISGVLRLSSCLASAPRSGCWITARVPQIPADLCAFFPRSVWKWCPTLQICALRISIDGHLKGKMSGFIAVVCHHMLTADMPSMSKSSYIFAYNHNPCNKEKDKVEFVCLILLRNHAHIIKVVFRFLACVH